MSRYDLFNGIKRKDKQRRAESEHSSDAPEDGVSSCPICCVAVGIRTKSFTLANTCRPRPLRLAS